MFLTYRFIVVLAMIHFAMHSFLNAKLEFTQELMGTEVRIVVDAPKNQALYDAVKGAFEEGRRLNQIFSDWEAESEVCRFSRSSRTGEWFELSDELLRVLQFSQNLARQSNGAFDVTIGPVSRLWRIARHQNQFPDQEKLQNSLSRTGFEKLIIDASNSRGKLTTPSMVLDLGGVAKGFIADQMLTSMKNKGFDRCLIDAGGDLTIGAPPRRKRGWQVDIGGLSNSILPSLDLSNCAVATSGDLNQFIEVEGKRYSHLINPKSGYGVDGNCQVTIIAKNGMFADAFASICLILDTSGARSFLNHYDFYKMYHIRKLVPSNEIQINQFHSNSID